MRSTCEACGWGRETDATWAPILEGTGGGSFNGSACVALASGNPACGKAHLEWDVCLRTACADCAESEAEACFADGAQQGACKPHTEALGAACGSAVNDFLSACNDLVRRHATKYMLEGPLIAQCIEAP